MKQSLFIARLRGYVRIQVEARTAEYFDSSHGGGWLLHLGYSSWQRWEAGAMYPHQGFLSTSTALETDRLQNACVVERFGLPFFMDKIGRRKSIAWWRSGFHHQYLRTDLFGLASYGGRQ